MHKNAEKTYFNHKHFTVQDKQWTHEQLSLVVDHSDNNTVLRIKWI